MFFSICLALTLAAQWTMGNPIEIVQTDIESGPKIPAKIIYLTFDDGPNQGTPEVLAVLKKHRVPATFFINSINLELYGSNARSTLLDTISDGIHTLGDHSYDHMAHNRVVRESFNIYWCEYPHSKISHWHRP